jgi:peptide/nickel transport system permease protein
MIYRLRRLANRALTILIGLLILSVVVFLVIRLLPGSVEDALLGPYAREDARAVIRAKYHLDDGILSQYWTWLQSVLQGDLGVSVRTGEPITQVIGTAATSSMELAVCAVLLAFVVSIVLGTIAGYRPGGVLDRIVSGLAVFGQSVPEFLVGLGLIYVVQQIWPTFPLFGYTPFWDDPASWAQHLILPVITLSLLLLGLLTRLTRNSVRTTLASDHVRTAISKGLPARTVFFQHVLRPSLIPVVTTAGLQLVGVLGGVVLVEVVFSTPGLGSVIVNAIGLRDYPLIQGAVLFIGVFAVVVNLLVDMVNHALDPRLRPS